MQSISSYINPNTRGLTSNYKNTAIKDKETYNEAMSQHLLNPVEDLVQVLKTPIKLAKSSSLSRQNNSVNIAEGQRIRVNGGHVLTVTAHGVEVSGGDNPYDTQSYVKAQRMADALASMVQIYWHCLRKNLKMVQGMNFILRDGCNMLKMAGRKKMIWY